jgi:hypothetical protein
MATAKPDKIAANAPKATRPNLATREILTISGASRVTVATATGKTTISNTAQAVSPSKDGKKYPFMGKEAPYPKR